jgi:hypothetical protein
MVLVDAWVLYKHTQLEIMDEAQMDHYKFLWQVAEGLLDLGEVGRCQNADATPRATCRRELVGKNTPGECVHCLHRKQRTRTTARCINCKVPLCSLGPCNHDYHVGHYKVHGKSKIAN